MLSVTPDSFDSPHAELSLHPEGCTQDGSEPSAPHSRGASDSGSAPATGSSSSSLACLLPRPHVFNSLALLDQNKQRYQGRARGGKEERRGRASRSASPAVLTSASAPGCPRCSLPTELRGCARERGYPRRTAGQPPPAPHRRAATLGAGLAP